MSTQTFPSTGKPQEEEIEEVDYDPTMSGGEEVEDVDYDPTKPPPGKKKEPVGDPDIYALARERRDQKNRLKAVSSAASSVQSAPGYVAPAASGEDFKKRLAEIDTELKDAGYDPDEIERLFHDFPKVNVKGFTGKEAMKLKAENPNLFDRKLSAIKSQEKIFSAAKKKFGDQKDKDGNSLYDQFVNRYIKGEYAKDYTSQRAATKAAIDDVHALFDDAEEQRKIIGDIVSDKSYGYGVGLPGQKEAFENDPRKAQFSPYQLTGIHFLEDVDPAAAKSYNRLLAFTPEELEEYKNNTSFMRAYESKTRDLENIGMNVERKALEEKMTSMQKNQANWDEAQQKEYDDLFRRYQMLAKDLEGQNQRYPAMAVIDADKLMQEALGESRKGVAEKTVLRIGENFDDARNWFGALMKAPFISDKDEAVDDLMLMGDKELSALNTYDIGKEQLYGPQNFYKFTGALKVELDRIQKDNTLTDAEKQERATMAILEDNRKNVTLVPNDEAGKVNMSGKTVLNTVSQIAGDLAPQLALSYLTAGSASPNSIRQLSSLFGSTFAVSYLDNYNQALRLNVPNPSQYATGHAIIESASELVHNDLEMAKKLFSGKVAAKALGSITRAEMASIGRAAGSRWRNFAKAATETGKRGAKSTAFETAEEGYSQGGTNILDKNAFNQNVGYGDDVMKSIVTTFVGYLPLTLLGLPAQYRSVNRMQQHAIYEAGMDPAKYLAKVNEDLANKTITEGEANKRKAVINRASAIIQEMSPVRPDGSMMTDNQKAKYVTNQLALQDIEQQLPNANEQQKAELETQQQLIENEQKQILTPKEKKLKLDEIEQNREEALAQAKEDYTHYPKDFQALQNDLINEHYDAQVKEFEKQEAEKLKEQEAKDKAKEEKAAAKAEQAKPATEAKEEATEEQTEEDETPIEDEATLEQELVKALQHEYGPQTEPPEVQAPGESAQPAITQSGISPEIAGTMGQIEQQPGTNATVPGTVPGQSQAVPGQSNAQAQQEAQARQPGQSEGLAMAARQQAPVSVAQKGDISNPAVPISTQEMGITREDTMSTVMDKLIAQGGAFTPMLQFIKDSPVMKRLKFELYDPKESHAVNAWLQEKGYDPKSFGGVFLPESRVKGKNFENLANTIVIRPDTSTNAYYDIVHELGHAATLENISGWKNLMSQRDQEFVTDVYNYIESKKRQTGYDIGNLSQYGLKSVEEFLVEAIINPDFRKFVSDVWAESRPEFLETTESLKPNDFIKVLMDFFKNLIRAALGKPAYAKDVEKRPLVDQAVDMMTKVYFGGQAQVVPQQQFGNTDIQLQETGIGQEGAAMPARVTKKTERAVKQIIKRTKPTISKKTLIKSIQKVTGLDEALIGQWIDEVRDPVVAPTSTTTVDELADTQYQAHLNQFRDLVNRDVPKKPNPFRTMWDSLRNASAQWDNPYRFVTKLVEDINKKYNLPNIEVIPLGRVFEKSGAGRAALRVDQFIQEVVYGRIGDKKYGQLKGVKYDDFQQYMAARRVIDRLNTEEAKRKAGEDVNRQTGNISRLSSEVMIDHLSKKYGEEGMREFEARAEAFQMHMDFMMQQLVASGILSQEAYNEIKADNDFYAPFSVVRQQQLANQDGPGVGITGVIKRIKGIGYDLQRFSGDALAALNDLGEALKKKQINVEEYFNTAVSTLEEAKNNGAITQEQYDSYMRGLESPGFQINDMIDAAANMIYRAEGMALKNNMMQRLYAYKQQDKEGLFIQDVDGFTLMTLPNGTQVQVPKPLNSIPVNEGFAPVKVRMDGKDKIVAINKKAADKINGINNPELPAILRYSDFFNKIFRAGVITLSPGFQVVNMMIDFIRASTLSRYGLLAGKSIKQTAANLALYPLQYMEAMGHSALGNVGVKTETYKQWMESDSFSKGMFDNLFDNNKRVKSIRSKSAKDILNKFFELIEIPGSIFEQTHKLAIHQRGMAVEGFKPKMFTAMMSSLVDQHIHAGMNERDLSDAMDRLNYEVQNYAGSPNFPQTAKWLKSASLFLQFFSARVKGETADFRRIANIVTGRGEGVKLSKQETVQMAAQLASIMYVIGAYAYANIADDEDEKEFDTIPSYHQDNYLHIPAGEFEYTDIEGNTTVMRDYMKMPLRGVTASMNVIANKFGKWLKHKDPKTFNEMALGVMGNASPMNLHGKDRHEWGESAVSNLTPVFKYFFEYSFNRDTHSHRDIIPDSHGSRSMLAAYRRGEILPYKVRTDKTPHWAVNFSRFLYDELGWWVAPITIQHMERTMGNPTQLYDKAIQKRMIRSEARYPVAGSTPMSEKPEPFEDETEQQDISTPGNP